MANRDVEALSAAKRSLLEQRMSGRAAVPSPISGPVARRTRSGPAPLSQPQEQLWYFSRLEPNNLLYNEAATIRKEGPFDVRALRVAWTEIVRRHEILRSTFELVDGEPMQVVHPAPTSELPVVDISGMPAAEREGEAVRIAAAQAKRPYDLARGPLTRGLLVRFAADHHRLYLALHQLVFDCVSLYRVILPELVSLYDAASAGREPSLPEPPIQYADYAAWLRERAMGTEFRDRIEYWRQHLGAAPALQLPLDHPRPPQPRFQGAIERPGISSELADELRSLARAHGATLFQVLSAAFTVFLHRLSGQDEIVFGTLGDLRDRPQLEDLVGYCVTPMVICADVRDDPAFSDLVVRIRGDLLAGLSHLVPFDQLVRELRPRREPGANPIFQAALVLQPPMPACDPSWSIQQVEPEAGNAVDNAKFDLQLELDERPDGHLDGRLIYSTDLFTPETAARMGRRWAALLLGICAAPTDRVSALPLLTEEERHRQLVEWNATSADYPRSACVHELVAAQVPQVPLVPAPSSSDLRERLRATLPGYMVPSSFVAMDALPLSPNGKIDRNALPAPRPGGEDGGIGSGAPRTALEERMLAIWARVLRVKNVGVDDDFFELGGHSLLAMRLLVEVERELGDEIPLAAFVEGSVTVAGLAATIEATRGGEAAGRSAIPIQPQGTLPILFFALADERSLLILRHLTGPLGSDQPVLGLLPDRVNRRFDRSGSVEDLAAPMLETVREAQPHGPYFLAGYSLGGMFAYEIAGRLRAAGEQVAWLGLLDTCTPALAGARWQLRKRVARGWKRGPRDALRKIEGVTWRELTALLVRLRLREPKLSDAFDHRGALMLATSYSCTGHDAPMDLFATDDSVAGAGSDSLGWTDIHRGRLRIHRMGGDHLSMFDDPYVDVLSAMVTRSARDALHATEGS